MRRPTDLVQGTLDLLILRTIQHEPKHGWAIAQRFRQVSNDDLKVQQASLYPALYRLEKDGWIAGRWAATDTGREASRARRRYKQRDSNGREVARAARLFGGAAGLVVASAGVPTLVALLPADVPRTEGIRVNGLVLCFAAIVSLGTALAAGTLPALRAARLSIPRVCGEA